MTRTLVPPIDAGSTGFRPSFWMAPETADIDKLAVGSSAGTASGNTPTMGSSRPAYHAGTVPALSFPDTSSLGSRLTFGDLTGFPYTHLTAGRGFWVGWLWRRSSSYTNRAVCGTGGNGAGIPGWNLQMSGSNATVSMSNGTSMNTLTLTHERAWPANEWGVSVVQVKIEATTITGFLTSEGYSVADSAHSLKTVNLTMDAVTPDRLFTIGDIRPTRVFPFDGDLSVAVGELPGNNWLSDEDVYHLFNYNRWRIWSDMKTKNNEFVKNAFAQPREEGFDFAVRTTKGLTINVYDRATRTLRGTSGALTPSIGFAKGSVTGLTSDEDVQAEFVDTSGNVAKREMHITVIPADNDYRFMVTGCSAWAEHDTKDSHRGTWLALMEGTRPHFCFWQEDFGYFNMQTRWPSGASTANYLTRFDEIFTDRRAYLFYDHIPTFTGFGDHHYEDDALGDSLQIPAGIEFARAMSPNPSSSFGDETDGTYYSFVLNDIDYVVMDVRTSRDEDTKVKLGTTQKTWWKGVITASEAANRVVINSWQDMLNAGIGDAQAWSPYFDTQLTELFDHIETVHGSVAPAMLSLTGDKHQIGADSGANQGNFDTDSDLLIPNVHATCFCRTLGSTLGSFDHETSPYASDFGLWAICTMTDNGATLSIATELWVATSQQGGDFNTTLTFPT